MINTLVSIDVDLASSLAIRFACQLGEVMDMEIQPVYVKESPPHESVVGAGWASRTWEKQMVEQGKAEISELITTEKEFCPVLREPRVIYGDREAELLKIMQGEAFDVFIEGAHFPWTPHELYKRLHTKLYQRLPSPVILVRTLRKLNHVQLLCMEAHGIKTLTKVFQKIWKNCSVPLVLNYPRGGAAQTESDRLREEVDKARDLLAESGCTVSIQDILSLDPQNDGERALRDSGLVAIAAERWTRKDSIELQWLNEVKTSSLVAFY